MSITHCNTTVGVGQAPHGPRSTLSLLSYSNADLVKVSRGADCHVVLTVIHDKPLPVLHGEMAGIYLFSLKGNLARASYSEETAHAHCVESPSHAAHDTGNVAAHSPGGNAFGPRSQDERGMPCAAFWW